MTRHDKLTEEKIKNCNSGFVELVCSVLGSRRLNFINRSETVRQAIFIDHLKPARIHRSKATIIFCVEVEHSYCKQCETKGGKRVNVSHL